MAIPKGELFVHRDLRYEVLRRWPGDHEVALTRIRRDDTPDQEPSLYLCCECSFDIDEENVLRSDPHSCTVLRAVRAACKDEARTRHAERWKRLGVRPAILDIFTRVSSGEYVGESIPGVIYVQEVAELLGRSVAEIRDACDTLFSEEKLDLNGMILTEYVRRFRFPRELQSLMRYMVEEPLGWPNGDAGDCFLAEIEGVIHHHTHLRHGKAAFWEHNYPNISAHLLLMFGESWLRLAAHRARTDDEAAASLAWTRLDRAAELLESLAADFRALDRSRRPLVAALSPLPRGIAKIAKALRRVADDGAVSQERLEPSLSLADRHAWRMRSLAFDGDAKLNRIAARMERAVAKARAPRKRGKVRVSTLRRLADELEITADRLASYLADLGD